MSAYEGYAAANRRLVAENGVLVGRISVLQAQVKRLTEALELEQEHQRQAVSNVQRLTEERDARSAEVRFFVRECDSLAAALAAKDDVLKRIEAMTNPATYGKGQVIPDVPVYEEVWLIAYAALARTALGATQKEEGSVGTCLNCGWREDSATRHTNCISAPTNITGAEAPEAEHDH